MKRSALERLDVLLHHACEGGLQNPNEYGELWNLYRDLKIETELNRKAATLWKRLASRLAGRLANHAFCEEHASKDSEAACPFCDDRSAYAEYLTAGGRDFRPRSSGKSISVFELRQKHERSS